MKAMYCMNTAICGMLSGLKSATQLNSNWPPAALMIMCQLIDYFQQKTQRSKSDTEQDD